MKIITIGTMKGGVGKTSVAFNLAGFLTKEKKRCLIIDADPQGNMSENLGIGQGFDEDYETFSHVLEKNIIPSHVIRKNVLDSIDCKIDLIPATIELTTTDTYLQLLAINKRTGHKQFSSWVEKHRETLEQYYDFIICDVGPNMNLTTQNCLYVSDEIYLVVDIGLNAFKGAKLLMSAWELSCEELSIKNQIKGIVINKYDKRTRLSTEFREYIMKEEAFKGKVFDTLIPETVAIRKAEIEGLPLAYHNPKCPASGAYLGFLKELRERGLL